MNLDQAYKILDYGTVPQNRGDQIQLIQIIGYTRLRGGKLLPDCHDRQLLRVTQRLFRKAEDTVQVELSAELKALHQEEETVRYHAFLCDSFNIPEAEREYHPVSELEEQLMQ